MIDRDKIDWQKMGGLLPCVVQDALTLHVLMLGYMNEEALAKTEATGFVTFYSRSRNTLWMKGEKSGHTLQVEELNVDCDGDALLCLATPKGPTCHEGVRSCFTQDASIGLGFLGDLQRLVAKRQRDMPENSYTTSLFQQGITRMAQKVGEEGVEVALAAKDDNLEAFLSEGADLIYHLLVLAQGKGVSFAQMVATLLDRHGVYVVNESS